MKVRKEDLHIGDVFRYDEHVYCKVLEIAVITDPLIFEGKPRILVSIFENVFGKKLGQRPLNENITEVEVVYRD